MKNFLEHQIVYILKFKRSWDWYLCCKYPI